MTAAAQHRHASRSQCSSGEFSATTRVRGMHACMLTVHDYAAGAKGRQRPHAQTRHAHSAETDSAQWQLTYGGMHVVFTVRLNCCSGIDIKGPSPPLLFPGRQQPLTDGSTMAFFNISTCSGVIPAMAFLMVSASIDRVTVLGRENLIVGRAVMPFGIVNGLRLPIFDIMLKDWRRFTF